LSKVAKACAMTTPTPPLPQPERRSFDRRREDALDEALAESFPASDPPSMVRSGAGRFRDDEPDRR
jgi:hypothetical protein